MHTRPSEGSEIWVIDASITCHFIFFLSDQCVCMPRLLQRLVNQLSAPKFRQVDRRIPYAPGSRGRRRPKSLFKPLPPEPSWSPSDRTQSIILDDLNPVIHRKIYEVHKTLPPRLRVSPRQGATTDEYDRPREMTAQERAWWSSPYRPCFMPQL